MAAAFGFEDGIEVLSAGMDLAPDRSDKCSPPTVYIYVNHTWALMIKQFIMKTLVPSGAVSATQP